jgi:hypothetical protein
MLAGIVVIVDVAGVAQLVEQIVVERPDLLLGEGVPGEALADRRRDVVEPPQVARDVEIRVGVLREKQARFRQIEMLAGYDFRETLQLRRHGPGERSTKSRVRKPSSQSAPK